MKRRCGKTLIGLLSLAIIVGIPLFILPTAGLALDYIFTKIDAPPTPPYDTYVRGINNAGQIVGYHSSQGFLRNTDGNFTPIQYGTNQTTPYGINDTGQIVGWFIGGGVEAAFLYNNGSFTFFNHPAAVSDTYFTDINDAGQIVGWYVGDSTHHGFLRNTDGSLAPIDYPGAEITQPHAINNIGQIVGHYEINGINHGFLRNTDGSLTPIDYPGANHTDLKGINDAGQIVGRYSDSVGQHGFLYSDGSFIPNDYQLLSDINNSGQIVGYFGDYYGVHGFIATPIPTTITVTINIRPQGDANRINLRKNEKVAVAILSTPEFDAPSQVDQDSLTFGATGDEQSLISCKRKPKDVNHDGVKDDLVCNFSVQLTGFQCDDTEGILKGLTLEGLLIEGKDSVNIVKCK